MLIMDSSISKKRILKNTFVLYVRQLITMLVSLYTVRVVLNTLGIEDFGVYNAVAGVVALFSFLSGSMASATQRYFSFAMGRHIDLKGIFTTNLLIYIIIAVVAILLLETCGLWFVLHRLNIPPGRQYEVCWLYHFSVLTFTGMVFSTPFIAIMIAHEDMHLYAGTSIIEAILKLIIVFLLMLFPGDKLVVYGALLFIVSLCNALLCIGICFLKYEECSFRRFLVEKTLLREIFSFTGWTLFGNFTNVIRNQAVTILLNQLFSPLVVAARSIALNVSGCVNIFANNFNVGLYPSIIKQYAAGERKQMFQLLFSGSKICFFLMWLLTLPMFLEMDFILDLWLEQLPEGAVLFSRLSLIESLIMAVSLPLTTAARAPGKMMMYELTLGIIQLLIFPASWFVLFCGGAASSVFIIAIAANLIMFIVRLFLLHRLIMLPVWKFIYSVIMPILLIIAFSAVPVSILESVLPSGLMNCFLVGILSLSLSALSMFFIGFCREERQKIVGIIMQKLQQKGVV